MNGEKNKLKACPFCGGKARLIRLFTSEREVGYCVECTHCRANIGFPMFIDSSVTGDSSIGFVGVDQDMAVEAWNRRAE